MSLYGDYLREREGRQIIEDECGFATYQIVGEQKQECYIVDIYVKPGFRKKRIATEYANWIADHAQSSGCTVLSGSVDPRTRGATESLKVLLGYGFELAGIAGGLIWFKKDLPKKEES